MALGYLISPVIQVEDVNGKPLVGGRIRVYEAGTTNPYITYKDWMGDRNPAEVILDAKGMCVLIADDTKTYDIYCEDRERVEQWSRLNVNVGQGGGGASGINNITSHDGSITVVRSGNTVDITLNDGEPSAIIARSRELEADGHFVFVGPPVNLVGDDLGIGDGYVRGNARWYHYDAMVRIGWQTPQNASKTISITGPDSVETVEFDLTFAHTEWITLAADYQVVNDGDALAFGISGMPEGMTAEIASLSVHNIVALDSEDHGEQYSAGNGITIQSGVIAIDPTVVQEKLEAGANISIVGNTISATAEPQQPADWAATEGVTRILNKPDLGVYATRSEVTTGLAGKQNVIPDLSTIRSGAAAGATAVQPSEMTSALAAKQDVISDLSTIRSGAAKGATSVQPADLAPYAVASDVETALAGKQDVINDLSTIRSGASAGATAVQPATMNSALAGKQDVISDLATIRTGAQAGATAVQPVTMNSALAGKQNVISDLSDIRSGAAAGTTAVQPADMNTALAGKQDVISDLSTIRSGAAAGATAVQPADMSTALAGKEDAANKSQTLDPASTTQFPSSAATASFVNSSVATNTATFRGNFKLPDLGLTYPATDAQIEAALDAHTWPAGVVPTNNDYVYVEIENPQTTGIDDVVKRFKYDGTEWHYEYTLNNSSFTAAEKAAIDSGIDSAKVAIYDAHVANGDIHVTAAEKATWNAKQDAISDLSTIRSGAAAGATAVQPSEMNTALAAKQDTISDLSTIRSGAAAGATAVQPGDLSAVATTGAYSDLSGTPTVDQTYSASSTNAQSGVAVASAIAGVNAVPASTSSDADKVLTVDAQGVPGWANAQAPISAGSGIDITNNVVSAKVDGTTIGTNTSGELESLVTQTNADWDAVSGASEILNKPVPKTLTAGTGISITENQSTITIANTSPVDQTYNASSTNAQSGVAVASGIADAIGDLPTNLTSAQILALKQALGVDETVLWSDAPVYVHGAGSWNPSITLSETVANFDRIRCYLGRKIGGDTCDEVIEVPVINGEAHHRIPSWPEGSVTGNWFLGGIDFVGASGSQWGSYNDSGQTQTKYLPNGWFPGGFWKVVGVGRIASN